MDNVTFYIHIYLFIYLFMCLYRKPADNRAAQNVCSGVPPL
jgi:hypothetical protein